MIDYQDFPSGEQHKVDFDIPEKVKSITMSYDGGRFFIYINGVEVYGNMTAGTDFNIEIT